MSLLGLASLVATAVALAGVGVVLVRSEREASRAPLPLRAIGVGVGLLGLGAIVAAAAGGGVSRALAAGASELILQGPSDLAIAHGLGSALVALWLMVPPAAGLGWLVLSRERSPAAAAVFAGVVGAGCVAGSAAALASTAGSASLALPGQVALVDVVGMRVYGAAGLGLGGGGLGIGVVAASSRAGLRAAVIATAAMPGLALSLGALTTPPDVVSQLMVAIPAGLCWLVGLAVGAVAQVAGSSARQTR